MSNLETTPFIIYNASAGSGKTHTLVRSFLYRLLSSSSPKQVRRLLAITFTNKAAQEMKQRILEKLERFASHLKSAEEDDMFMELVTLCEISTDALHQRSKKAYVYILHHFGQLHVATIDKLTHQIIRTFARDFGMNARFDVALDSNDFMTEVVARILNEAGEDKALTKTLIAYVLQKADELKSWDITKEVFTVAQMFINENHMQPLAKLAEIPMDAFTTLDRKIAHQIHTIKTPFKEIATTILAFFKQWELTDDLFPRKTLPNLLRFLQQGDWGKEPLNKTMQKSMEKGIFLKAAATKQQTLLDPITDDIVDLLQSYNRYWRQVSLLELLRKNIVPLSLIQRIGEEVNQLQDERNSRLLGFFNKHISDNIKDTPAPFIYERLGVRYQHFFVDEFQDTSELQWANLHPLFAHALEGEQQKGSLVLVGDAKQSIYRWRGGNPEQFMKLTNKEVPFTVLPKVENLPTNYRSGQNIVSFNNTFFSKAAQFLPRNFQQKLYSDSCNQLAHFKEGGYITLATIEGAHKEAQTHAYQQSVIKKVTDCMQHGYRKKDICVLVRKNEQGVQIASALTEAGIPITSSDALLIGQSPEVQFLMHLVKLRLEPKNRISQYAVLERFALQQRDPHAWTEQQFSHPLREVLLQNTDKKFDFSVFQQLTLYAALEYAVWAFSLTDKLTAHIQAFLDEILKLQGKKEATATQVLARWEQQKDSWTVRPPEDRDAVQIMTIHKAKGLAFPVVILPFSDAAWMNRNNTNAWYPLPKDVYAPFEEMLLPVSKRLNAMGDGAKQTYETYFSQAVMDTLNTLYVGMTRPREELHIITQKSELNDVPNNLADVFSTLFPALLDKPQVFGERKKPSHKDDQRKTTSTPWRFHVAHTTNVIPKSHKKAEEVQYGLLFHEIMAQIEVSQDISHALTHSKAKEVLSTEKYAELELHIREVVHHKELHVFFDPANEIYCERPLLTETGEIVRPDRFVVTKNKEVFLLDYKTGSYNKNHENQINEYAKALKKGSTVIKQKSLVYINNHIMIRSIKQAS
jgi:ATP-dependent exoDNAse (exonuclease V) beta subunit